MSVRLPPSALAQQPRNEDRESEGSELAEDEEDNNFDDWVSDSVDRQPCKSLFEDKILPSVTEALEYDRKTHNFDLNAMCSRLSLDFHQRIRLVNYIRKEKLSGMDALNLKGDEAFFSADEYLLPSLEDDPLLQVQTDDWSDEEDPTGDASLEPKDLKAALRRIQALENDLLRSKQDLIDYRSLVSQQVDLAGFVQDLGDTGSSLPETSRDDDSHYFESYGENDIHAVMIQDKVRTATYASFIMGSPVLFKDAIVLDVGCGTGILSLFAARAGAKRVFAVDASKIADKARQIVKDNGYEDVVTVIQGKVEDIKLPDEFNDVDVIISEWMGYALLYESMLDSVLRARDRFLRPGGVMAPSQCQMMLSLCEAKDLHKERIGFWSDIYGFDLSAMAQDVYHDAVVDVVGPETLVSEPCLIKDLQLGTITSRQLSFSSPFTLISTADRRTKVRALLLYFDTFFTVTGQPIPPGTEVNILSQGDAMLAEVWPVGALPGRMPKPVRRESQGEGLKKDKVTSFSTGPKSEPTHWKQTLFFLREPIVVEEGTVVSGTFHCRKSEGNLRELDVEIHYTVKDAQDSEPGDVVVQMFRVR
ncbi:S-adenosyl-L-methionine-dependent methyltransferase [Neolentinus lepideus HHB14362 ss-1]|uniref:type I protein arginine methyltransferase n=1 Tax=Neolentinus lepideus HHB14362 ss-1 TaxID=1314782 RepID=A0A165UU54_9AGAM|nr:S-adenosyl-L-methionine-dependent methyltransferase [Neolentinus lepideus HHB14362 ss-1]